MKISPKQNKEVFNGAEENSNRQDLLASCVFVGIRIAFKKDKPLSVIADEIETEPEELSVLYQIVSENMEKPAKEGYFSRIRKAQGLPHWA